MRLYGVVKGLVARSDMNGKICKIVRNAGIRWTCHVFTATTPYYEMGNLDAKNITCYTDDEWSDKHFHKLQIKFNDDMYVETVTQGKRAKITRLMGPKNHITGKGYQVCMATENLVPLTVGYELFHIMKEHMRNGGLNHTVRLDVYAKRDKIVELYKARGQLDVDMYTTYDLSAL